ncbi:superoxide dismutase family protein [Paenibacillus lautus]|uniref:superoxide dismutase family protein n=1 Tax=Paenibacillus lautus TaxID=1401 RepID=UPI002DBEDF39|nr:superoxide dismutase family protein [Paenibacillus lautus]MEC0259744.1 superoxide dismutase family protein [Paenibacillus lautus]
MKRLLMIMMLYMTALLVGCDKETGWETMQLLDEQVVEIRISDFETNLVVGADGTVEAETIIQHGTLEKNQPNSVLGRSLIIHAGEDDNVTDPAGNSGDRVVGGNIPE